MTSWKIIGFAGTAIFAGRWAVQFLYARRAGRSVVTPAFWLMSLFGNLLLILYFGFGPSADAVGLVGNALPGAVALYNLWLLFRRRPAPLASMPAQEQGRPA